ncbi:hypothetical protein [Craterilacuibacter sp.]|uniref:hypothetical protein n=1 Tax=Craterilacuibacter sp. TaxID=2870909 RepID=UPI003F2D1535
MTIKILGPAEFEHLAIGACLLGGGGGGPLAGARTLAIKKPAHTAPVFGLIMM